MSTKNKRLANPQVQVNNLPIAIIPNSCKYNEGLGEQTVEPQSAGGNSVTAVYGEDVSTRLGQVTFELANTEDNIALVRQWKLNTNANVVSLSSDTFSRSFTNMTLTNDYEVGLGSDTNLSLEWKGDPAV